MIELFKLDASASFPPVEEALDEPNGLLAFGGDLSVNRLRQAYYHGVFPWFSEGEPLLWWSPDPRGIVFLADAHVSQSTKRAYKREAFHITINTAFVDTIRACAKIPRKDISHGVPNGTWITEEMIQAYIHLHESGSAHSVEVWKGEKLVGGLYGVAVGRIFCGESMFHYANDASKVAFWALTVHLIRHQFHLIDCQMYTSHLGSLGCIEVPRANFIQHLSRFRDANPPNECWQAQAISL